MSDMEWTEQRDRFLVFYGRCLEAAFESRQAAMETLSRNDFPGTTWEELSARLDHLRQTRPNWCADLERDADTDFEGATASASYKAGRAAARDFTKH